MEIGFIHTKILVRLHVNKTNFHMKGFALGLALEQRRKATRKSLFLNVIVRSEMCSLALQRLSWQRHITTILFVCLFVCLFRFRRYRRAADLAKVGSYRNNDHRLKRKSPHGYRVCMSIHPHWSHPLVAHSYNKCVFAFVCLSVHCECNWL